MKRLNSIELRGLPPNVQVPTYDRKRRGVGIVHLGIGAFHRAHQAVYTEDAMEMVESDWCIIGASLRSRNVHDQLVPQDGLYTVMEQEGSNRQCRVIGAVQDVIFAPGESQRLLNLMSDPKTRIVTLTVTEKGYYRDPARGELLKKDPAILADLANPALPGTAIGFLAQALDMRRLAGVPPFTALSCDNLPHNGSSLRRVVLEYASLALPEAASWIENNAAFPCSMVDRIVPATTEAGLSSIASEIGLRDEGAVLTEPFRQWIIEDQFTMGRPAWEKVGAMLVDDVSPYELIKLRLLNGPHSSLAYLGYLGGMKYVSDCMNNPSLRRFATRLMREEIQQTVNAPEEFDIDAYIEALLTRFSNPALHHRCWQIAMDGSQKLPQRLLGTIRDRLRKDLPIDRLALAVAGWIQYVTGIDLNGREIDVRDPLAEMLRKKLSPYLGNAASMTKAALQITDVFGDDLSLNKTLQAVTTEKLAILIEKGSLGACEEPV